MVMWRNCLNWLYKITKNTYASSLKPTDMCILGDWFVQSCPDNIARLANFASS